LICFDTEDDTQGSVKIVNFFDGERHTTYTGENCRFKAWAYLYQNQPEIYWAVNAQYDLVNLFGKWLAHVCTLQYVRSGLMRATFNDAKAMFYDTLRHWPASVEDMGEKIGLPKLKMPHIGCDCDDCVEYCQRDTEITWRFVDEMTSRYRALGIDRIRSTLPSMALQLFKQFYQREFPRLDDYHINEMRKGYYGGRVEVYQLGSICNRQFFEEMKNDLEWFEENKNARLIDGRINHYDINSLFPSVMLSNSYPDLDTLSVTDEPDLQKEGIFEGWVFVPYTRFPCLPVRDFELIFPHGALYGSWPYPELRQLLEDGGKIVKCKQAIEFSETENPFDGYIKFCYGKRLEASDELDNLFWKLMLNSLYGKFGQIGNIEVIYHDEDKIIEGRARHASVIWSAYVTSYARLALLRFLRECNNVFYTDTDSLFTLDNLRTSNKLGDLKQEDIYSAAEFKGNKIYCTTKDNEVAYKAKGVPRKYQGDFFRTGKARFMRPTKFREARRRKIQPNIWSEVEKESHMSYTKRKILPDGSTEPWNIMDYRQFLKDL